MIKPSVLIKVSAEVGMTSLIGVSGNAPYAWGNYFALKDPYIRVLNFWAENLKAAVDRHFLADGLVQIRMWEWETEQGKRHVCIIEDERIPADWYYQKLCFTGGGGIPTEVARDIYAIVGDPDNELERFIDPEMYYAKRGGKWVHSEGNNFNSVSYNQTRTREEEARVLTEALIEKRAQQSS
jgi:hypothetical protein